MQSIRLRNFLLCLFVVCSALVHAQNKSSFVGTNFANDFTSKDTVFKKPFIDVDESRDKPVRHRYVHSGFKENGTRFSQRDGNTEAPFARI